MRIIHASTAVLMLLLFPATVPAETPGKLPWGAGVYGGANAGATELDNARWDWMAGHSSLAAPENVRQLNRLLKINPRQKYLFQVTGNFLSNGRPEHGGQMNFLDFHFDATRRESLRNSLRDQVREIVNGLSKPQNIAAFTFYEELPGNWGVTHLLRPAILKQDKNEQGAFPSFLKPYQKQIEQERGQPLVWDEDTWRYLGKLYTETINEIHQTIKTASGGKPVYYWLHNGMATLDQLPKDWTFATATGTEAAYRLTDIIRPGLCDGLMTYPSSAERWQVMWPLIQKHRWRYFAQLWHPGAFRLDTWDATVARTLAPNPWNQGFFFYCEGGGCARPSGWNDPAMGAAEANAKDRFVTPVRDAQEGPALRIATPSPVVSAFNHQYLNEATPGDPIQGGKPYRWSVRIKTRDIVDGPAGAKRGASLYVRWFNKTAQVREDWLVGLLGTHDWQTYAGTIIPPADAVNACIFVFIWQASGEALFTKLSLKAEGNDAELIGNGSFEKFIPSPLKFDYWYHVDDSITLAHLRYFCNKYHVGDDVVARYFKLGIQFDQPPPALKAGKPFTISARLTNTRDTSFYSRAEDTVARDVRAVLKLPRGLKLVERPQTEKESLIAGGQAVRQWLLVAKKPGTYRVRAEAKSPNMPGTTTEMSLSLE